MRIQFIIQTGTHLRAERLIIAQEKHKSGSHDHPSCSSISRCCCCVCFPCAKASTERLSKETQITPALCQTQSADLELILNHKATFSYTALKAK